MSKITDAIKDLNKRYGDGTVMKMDEQPRRDIEVVSTGNVLIDDVIGVGGIPYGRITEFNGPEGCGKSTLAMQVMAQAQKQGRTCALVDAEHAFDPRYAEKLGMDVDNMIVSQPAYGEQALEVVEALTDTGEVGVIVVDSVAALTPRAEVEGEMGDSHVGLHARLMSQAMRKLSGKVHSNDAALIFINQLRENIGMMGYGPKTTTTGGRALKFFASLRLELKPVGKIKKGDDLVGDNIRVKTVKNRLSPPFQVVDTELIFGKGFSNEGAILDICLECGIFKQSGSWFSSNDGIKLGQGREAARLYLEENPEWADEQLGIAIDTQGE